MKVEGESPVSAFRNAVRRHCEDMGSSPEIAVAVEQVLRDQYEKRKENPPDDLQERAKMIANFVLVAAFEAMVAERCRAR